MKNRITTSDEAREYLAKADPVIGAVIGDYGEIDYELSTDIWLPCFQILWGNNCRDGWQM
jgi:hypothetical protein